MPWQGMKMIRRQEYERQKDESTVGNGDFKA